MITRIIRIMLKIEKEEVNSEIESQTRIFIYLLLINKLINVLFN